MTPSLTDTLCTRCGLCCDGTLFADVELTGRAETTRLVALGLEVDESDAEGDVLVQPCAALRGTRCGVYPHRPACCRAFECRLLGESQRGAVTVDAALATIAATRSLVRRAVALLARLGQRDTCLPLAERAAQAVADAADAGPAQRERADALESTMAALRPVLRSRFIGPGARAR